MAYLKEITTDPCDKCRRARPVVELLTHHNATIGQYCRKCGNQALRRHQKLIEQAAE